jgi:hypothetical protein
MHLEEAARSERMAGPRQTWKEPTEECGQWRTWRPRASHLEQNLIQHPQPRTRPARPPSPRATKPPRSQHSAFKKGTMPKCRRWPVQQNGPRVSPGTKRGRGAAPTQEHASKEGVAPTGVTMVRISNAEQGFHSGRRPHPGGTETGGSMHQEPPQKSTCR